MNYLRAHLRAFCTNLPTNILVVLLLLISARYLGIGEKIEAASPDTSQLVAVLPQLKPFHPTLECLRQNDSVVFNVAGSVQPKANGAVLALHFANLTAPELETCRQLCDPTNTRTTVVAHVVPVAAAFEAARQQQAPGGLHDSNLPGKTFDLYLFLMELNGEKTS